MEPTIGHITTIAVQTDRDIRACRVRRLHLLKPGNPHREADIDALIAYYENGGALPDNDEVLYAIDGKVGCGLFEDVGRTTSVKRQQPLIDVRVLTSAQTKTC